MTFSQLNWVVALASTAFALNSTVSVSHGKSPFAFLFGREPSLPLDLAMPKLSNFTIQAVFKFISSQEKSFSDVGMALAKTNESMVCSADQHLHNIQFHSGDLVYVNTAHFSLAPGLSRKLVHKWIGTFS